MKSRTPREIRVGVVGLRRGMTFAGDMARHAGFKLVALCDVRADRLEAQGKARQVAVYTDYGKFLEHDMDAVVLANYFHQHAPFAVRALRAGFHVMSETAACHTLAEGVELGRAVEKSGRVYLFAENYAYMRHNQEMRRVFQTGALGSFMYGEGEYVHPMDADSGNRLSPGLGHWRNWIPATYYCTHALSPIMYITETWPAKVNGFVIRKAPDSPVTRLRASCGDAASMIAVRMDNRAVVKLLQVSLRGENISTRIHAARGYLYGRGNQVTLVREQYHEPRRYPQTMTYVPDFPSMHLLSMRAGHGGGDLFVMLAFAEAIRTGRPPFLDVYRGVAMSVVGILAYRSALNDSNTEVVPDFRREADRRRVANDHWSPDPARRGPGQPWPSIDGRQPVSAQALARARREWKAAGFDV